MKLRCLLIIDNLERAELLRGSLHSYGHSVVDEATIDSDFLSTIEAGNPDLLLIDSDTPDSTLFLHLRELSQRRPLPVVLFTQDDNRELIGKAVQAGVSAYIVDGLNPRRLGSILDVALVRFRETERLRRELRTTQASLSERKTIERAKGILMKQRGCDESQAYHALRKMAMNKNLRIGQVAENVIAVSELLN